MRHRSNPIRSKPKATGNAGAWFANNGLSAALLLMFLAATIGQIVFGFHTCNHQRLAHGLVPFSLGGYLTSGHFLGALFENWESEFLQMGIFVLLLVKLRQKGSAESKPCDEPFEGDEPTAAHRTDPNAPLPVVKGGVLLWLYENSLASAFFALFLVSFVLHAVGGYRAVTQDPLTAGSIDGFWQFVASDEFWFQSFQNWQSEFLSVFCIVVFTIFLRQHGSPQSKPVWAPHSKTGT